jgi:hypothetical protein
MKTSKAIITAVEFTVEDKLVVADPCYIDSDDGSFEENVKSGILSRSGGGIVFEGAVGDWVAEIETQDEGAWGIRVGKLHLSRKGARSYLSRRLKDVGEVGVDSGQMGAFCATCLPLDYDALLNAYEGDHSRNMLAFGGGAVSSTGYGDGSYEVTAAYDNDDRPVEIVVDFLPEEEPEDFDWDEDED